MKWNNKNTRRKKEKFQEKVNSLIKGGDRMRGLNSLCNLKNSKSQSV